jgi:hypothetical protein
MSIQLKLEHDKMCMHVQHHSRCEKRWPHFEGKQKKKKKKNENFETLKIHARSTAAKLVTAL